MNTKLFRTFNSLLIMFLLAAGSLTYAQVRPYRVNDTQLRNLLTRIETRTDTFRRQVDRDLDNSRRDGTTYEERIAEYVTDFENATDSLRRNFNERDSTTADVQEVLQRASFINTFMSRNRMAPATVNQWNLLKADLNTLANYYRTSWNWNNNPNQPFPGTSGPVYGRGLTGTYRLNVSQSDNVDAVIDRTIRNTNRDRARTNLERRLTAPEMIAIEQNGRNVTMASTLSPQVTFTADGRTQTETNPNGRTVQVTASTSTASGLTINYVGDRMNDFFVTFTPLSNGQLRVTRRVYMENRNQTVTVTSVYDRTSSVAQWSSVNTNTNTGGYDNTNPNTNPVTSGEFIIPNNTRLVAVLNNMISTKESQNGDRFTMEVTSPSQYRGAIIEGRVASSERSGRVSGRANMSLEFDTIRLRDGRTYRFAGIADQVKLPNGDTVTVNNEGTVRDNNQTTKTVTRAGIGAAIGAIIGAVTGGGQGAAVGAVIGAGAGAGSVILQGRDDVVLTQGTEFQITASAPANVGYYR